MYQYETLINTSKKKKGKKKKHTHTPEKYLEKKKKKICINALDFFDLVLPIFFFFKSF